MNKLILTICFCSTFLFLFSCNMPDYTKDIETLYQQIKNDENGSTGDSDTGDPDNLPNRYNLGNICTGQTSCYNTKSGETISCPSSLSDDFYGQDAQYTNKCVAQSFTLGTGAQAGTVIDNNTGLIWEQSPSESTYTWDDAPNHCADLNSSNYSGINTWRVPNPLELLTIVDNSTYNPATNSNFTNMPTDYSVWFWTSAEYKGNTSYAYVFVPSDGFCGESYVYSDVLKTKTYKVLCVSGNEMLPATSANFTTQTISGKVVVTDSKTGLMWQKEYVSEGTTWQNALKYCEDSTYAGYSDWRLPNKNELSSLINYEKSGAPYSYFPDMPSEWFWSSSTYVYATDYAWLVDFNYSFMGNCLKTFTGHYGYVRCVRNAGDTETDEETCTAQGGNWNGSQCTRTQNCTGLPENAEWNGGESYSQIYAGSSWSEEIPAEYSEDAGECHFKCVENYFWNGSACVVSPCNSNPCSSIENSTEICTATSATGYSCGCNSGYYWWENEKGCLDKRPLSLAEICTDQNKCYNNTKEITCPAEGEDFFGQDAWYASLGKCTPQSFTAGIGAQEGTVIDNNTGLVWEQSPSEDTYTWDEAQNHCNDLNSSNYGGKNNWRVPNPLEFMTIVDNSTYNPATNSNFTNMPTDSSVLFWTSKEYKGNTSYAYAFNPYYGVYGGYGIGSYSKNKTYKVLCVSGNEIQPATTSNFTTQTISASGVVTDSATGLMWQKEYETGKTWQQALKYCEDSTYAGYSDWRLPNKNELSSLINYEKSGSPSSYFPDMPDSFFWSSSTVSDNTDIAWLVYFSGGGVGYNGKAYSGNVRCVR